MTEDLDRFEPKWPLPPPGDTILDILKEKNWTQCEFADRFGWNERSAAVRSSGCRERRNIVRPYVEDDAVMIRYPALIDGERGAYGVSFPDIPGVVAMGVTMDEALLNAEEALRDYVIETEKTGDELVSPSLIEEIETPAGSALVSVSLIRLSGRSVRANLTLDEEVVTYIDGEARRRGMTRTKFVEWMTRRIAQMGG